MRLAYVDVNARFMNPTREKAIEALSGCGDVKMIGPGFSAGDSGAQLQNLLNEPDAIDAVLFSTHIANGYSYEHVDYKAIADIYKKSYVFDFPESHFQELSLLYSLLVQAKVPRILLAVESDYFNYKPQQIEAYDRVADMIVGLGPECWSYKSAMANVHHELFAEAVNDHWADYLSEHADKVSSILHVIGEDEFCYTPLALRKTKWSVLGVPYYARKMAISALKKAGLPPSVTNTTRRLLAGLKKVKILSGETNWYLDITQNKFKKALQNSRYSYTCGSGIDLPIRKFFEIPAAGAVLVCRPFRGAKEFGFVDGENFIACEPKDIVDVHHWLEANPEKAQQIATAGQAMVKALHSVEVRREQLRQIIQATVDKKGVGKWCDGHFKIVGQDFDRHRYLPLAGAAHEERNS